MATELTAPASYLLPRRVRLPGGVQEHVLVRRRLHLTRHPWARPVTERLAASSRAPRLAIRRGAGTWRRRPGRAATSSRTSPRGPPSARAGDAAPRGPAMDGPGAGQESVTRLSRPSPGAERGRSARRAPTGSRTGTPSHIGPRPQPCLRRLGARRRGRRRPVPRSTARTRRER